jgi:hypothetical protein
MPERIICCMAGILCMMVGFIALAQMPALGQAWRGHGNHERGDPELDRQLVKVLAAVGFSGRIESRIEAR